MAANRTDGADSGRKCRRLYPFSGNCHSSGYSGINIVGLRRRGFSNETINNIHNAYRLLYNSGYNVSDAVKHIKEEIPRCPEVDNIINFIENISTRGIIG